MPHSPRPALALITPPGSEPLTLAEAKLYLRVDGTVEDSLITSLIASAREAAERYLRRSLVTQTWRLAFDDYAPATVALLMGPVQSVASVKTLSRDGTETTLNPDNYYLNAAGDMLELDASPFGHRVEITYTAGFGDAPDIPQPLRHGLLAHIAALYDQRGVGGVMPDASKSLYAPYREVRI